jgi:hypothetical protein
LWCGLGGGWTAQVFARAYGFGECLSVFPFVSHAFSFCLRLDCGYCLGWLLVVEVALAGHVRRAVLEGVDAVFQGDVRVAAVALVSFPPVLVFAAVRGCAEVPSFRFLVLAWLG